MTREEEIINEGIEYTMSHHPMCIGGGAFADAMREFNRNAAFEAGAKWADSHSLKGTSIIKWQTGIPDERCAYIVTLQDGTVNFDYFGFWGDAPKVWQKHNEYSIKAWCKLSDIEVFKE